MSYPAIPAVEDVIDASAKVQLETFLDQHRVALNACLDGLTEQQRESCQASREAVAALQLGDLVHGNRRGPLPLRWVYLHVLRELAQHCGHADILREQLLDGGAGD